MSIKINNGLKISANSLDEVINNFFSVKDEIKKSIEIQLIKEVLIEIIEQYDKYTLHGESLPFEESKLVIENIANNKSTQSIIMDKLWEKNDMNDHQKEIFMLIYPQSVDYFGQKSYLMQFFADKEIYKIMEQQYMPRLNIEDYCYWNSSDHPEEVTEYEWSMREKHWKKIDIPLLDGISMTFLKSSKYEVFYNYCYGSNKQILQNTLKDLLLQYNVEKRIEINILKLKEKIAYKQCYGQFLIDHNLENVDPVVLNEKLATLMNESMKIYFESTNKAIKNDFNEEQQLDIAEKSKDIELLLKKEFIIEDFNNNVGEINKKAKELLLNSPNKKYKM